MSTSDPPTKKGLLHRVLDKVPKKYRTAVLVLIMAPKLGYVYLIGKYLVAKKVVFFTFIGLGEMVLGQ